MTNTFDAADFRLERLSVREREVLDLAAEGRTDEQIAQTLKVATTTVNSYWTRIRMKLGPYSRTDLVARMLRSGFRETHEGLLQEVERLNALLAGAVPSPDAPWPLLALHLVPEAVFVADGSGNVVYANLVAEMMFVAEQGALRSRPISDLAVPEERLAKWERIGGFFAAGVPGRVVMGVEEACHALRHDGESFRATFSVEGFHAPEGFMAVFTVREVLGSPEDALRSVRKPIEMA